MSSAYKHLVTERGVPKQGLSTYEVAVEQEFGSSALRAINMELDDSDIKQAQRWTFNDVAAFATELKDYFETRSSRRIDGTTIKKLMEHQSSSRAELGSEHPTTSREEIEMDFWMRRAAIGPGYPVHRVVRDALDE